MKKPFFYILFNLSLFLLGCAYQVRRGDLRLANVKEGKEVKLFLPLVDNLTVKPAIEGMLTSSVRRVMEKVDHLEVVVNPNQATHFLIGTITEYDLTTRSLRQGNTSTESLGGLASKQSTAQDFNVRLKARFQLIERTGDELLKREIWVRDFIGEGSFEASQRLNQRGGDLYAGSESSVHINHSREMIRVQELSDSIAAQVLDQVAQDF